MSALLIVLLTVTQAAAFDRSVPVVKVSPDIKLPANLDWRKPILIADNPSIGFNLSGFNMPVPPGSGGTGLVAPGADGNLLISDGAGNWTSSTFADSIAPGTALRILTSNGTAWVSADLTASQMAIAVPPSTTGNLLTSNGTTWISQAMDGTLTALAAFNTNGFVVQNGSDSFVGRTLTSPLGTININNATGGSGDPELEIGDIVGSNGVITRTAASTYASVAPSTSGNVLTSNGSAWVSQAPAADVGFANPMTTQGDIIVGGASGTPARQALGATGTVLRSDGNAPIPSTATFPDTATSGKVLRASGANVWANSTASYPDTAGTSGNVLTSDGSNFVSQALVVTSAAPADVVGGRLTLETGVPVSTTTQDNRTTLYYTPYVSGQISLYNGSAWVSCTFTEISASLSGLTATRPYDVFVYDSDANGTADALDLVAWTSTTARATALATQNGVFVKSGATGRRWVGTVAMDGTGAADDWYGHRGVYNWYNQRLRPVYAIKSTSSWTYSSASYQAFDAGGGSSVGTNWVKIMCGQPADVSLRATQHLQANSTTAAAMAGVGIGVNASNALATGCVCGMSGSRDGETAVDTNYDYFSSSASYSGVLPAQVNNCYPIEVSPGGTSTFYGTTSYTTAGLSGQIFM